MARTKRFPPITPLPPHVAVAVEEAQTAPRLAQPGAKYGRALTAMEAAMASLSERRRGYGPMARGRCIVCEREIVTTEDGKPRWHGPENARCTGSKFPADPL